LRLRIGVAVAGLLVLGAGAARAASEVGAGSAVVAAAPVAATADRRPVGKADKIVVMKGEKRLYLLRDGEVVRSYRVALGRQPRGTKLYEGDGRTPEGRYVLDARNADSRFYRAFHVSYPNASDRARASALGQAAGGLIMIHGLPRERPAWGAEHWMYNWTTGCIAVTDREMDEIWESVEVGTPIEIRP
jgi:murein L,D-transpeptidase YafK